MTANNDAAVRVFDTENFACLGRFTFPWSVNNTFVSPDRKLLAVLGDNVNCLIADAQSGKRTFGIFFSPAWHPDGEDPSYRVTVTHHGLTGREESFSILVVLKGRMGAIRALSDARFMAMFEPKPDFVHIYDTQLKV
ncbi:hypothetical protein IFM89_028171 [Coptis chinensis]|uniref:Uncharacterized protein n=1 Tax=Coptis chinensis TaxID=261450 RepID=A0A835HVE7_9MAGN|nr:hypothetical protein IFM89_028171 [Coptis chinensis]